MEKKDLRIVYMMPITRDGTKRPREPLLQLSMGLNASLKATCFPTAAAIANSWDPELGEEIGKALGEEAAAQNVNIVLGPGLNTCKSRGNDIGSLLPMGVDWRTGE